MTEGTRDAVLDRLRHVAAALGEERSKRVALVGGCVPATIAGPHGIRPTEDVDLIVAATTYTDWHRFCRGLSELGIVPGRSHIARHMLEDIPIDVMATAWPGAGDNRWYPEAFANRVFHEDIGLHVIAPPWFLATKLVAHTSRGANDPLSSHDLEDVVRLLSASEEWVEWLRSPPEQAVHRFVVFELRRLALRPDGLQIIQAHHEANEAAQQRAEWVWRTLCEL